MPSPFAHCSYAALLCFLNLPIAQAQTPGTDTATIDRGKKMFHQFGCYSCHGMEAQGAQFTGPRLASTVWPSEAIAVYIRNPAGEMPPYAAATVSDAQVAAIRAWLVTLPKPKEPDKIELLR